MSPLLRITARAPGRGSRQRGGIVLRLMLFLMVVALLAALYLLREPLLSAAGGYWVVDESPLPASDVILVLGPDNYHSDRAARAAELFRERWATRVVASGSQLRPYFSEAEMMARDLTERGVPAAAILRFPHGARSTREEALALARLIAEQRWQRVLVVTSNYHTRRTRYIFRRVLPVDIELRVIAATDRDYDPAAWWKSRWGLRLFFREVLAMPLAIWEMFRGASILGSSTVIQLGQVRPVGVREFS
jgi:uncharacterized SAM-binding protein YcdF (DUF218 family)